VTDTLFYRKICLFEAVLTSGLLTLVSAQETGFEQKIQGAKTTFIQSRMEVTLTALEAYQTRLLKLENTLAANRDYAGAIPVQEERRRIEIQIARAKSLSADTFPPNRGASGIISLAAPAAETGGSVVLDPKTKTLSGWATAKDYAEWPLPPELSPGGYEIQLEYACEKGGGTYQIRETFYTLTRTVKPTGGAADFEKTVVGTLRLKASSPTLRITSLADSSPPLFSLRGVRLVPSNHIGTSP